MTKKQKAIAAAATAVAAGAYFLSTAEPQPTYLTVRWTCHSNGVLVHPPTVICYSTNLRDWQPIATNITGNITVCTDSSTAFFKVHPL